MKNRLFFAFLTFTYLLFLISCGPPVDEGFISQGIINFDAEVLNTDSPMASMAPSTMVYKFKDNKSSVEMSAGMGLLKTSFISDPEKITFTQISSATPSDSEYVSPNLSPVLIEDRSIKTEVDISYNIIAKNPLFYIDSVDPPDGDFYLQNDYNNGRLIITFNSRPASNFLDNKYFLCQRKPIQKAPSRWENLYCAISAHSWRPEVYIDFPSLDATPSFFTDGKNYFEQNYKYRVKISKDIGI